MHSALQLGPAEAPVLAPNLWRVAFDRILIDRMNTECIAKGIHLFYNAANISCRLVNKHVDPDPQREKERALGEATNAY